MNLVIGGGVIGLPYVASNFGYVGFLIAIGSVFVVALTTQYFILSGNGNIILFPLFEYPV